MPGSCIGVLEHPSEVLFFRGFFCDSEAPSDTLDMEFIELILSLTDIANNPSSKKLQQRKTTKRVAF